MGQNENWTDMVERLRPSYVDAIHVRYGRAQCRLDQGAASALHSLTFAEIAKRVAA